MSKFNTWSYLEQIIFYDKQERHPLAGPAREIELFQRNIQNKGRLNNSAVRRRFLNNA